MKNVAIVEDEREAADTLASFLDKYGAAHNEVFNVCRFGDAVTFLMNYSADYDVVFMDIEMPEMNGMDASAKLRALDRDVILIFVTNMAQYAVNGYEVGAFDFIVKPVSYANFALKFGRAMRKLQTVADAQIWIKGKTGNRRVAVSSIFYVEVMNHVIIYHTDEGAIVSSGSMKAVRELLVGEAFALCNQSYLVNLRYVTALKGLTVVVGGRELPISNPKKAAFIRAVNLYFNGRREKL